MGNAKKPSLENYVSWLSQSLGINAEDAGIRNRYQINAQACQTRIQADPFVSAIADKALNDSTYNIISLPSNLQFSIKPFDSVLEKTFRVNILGNRDFPSAPPNGWVTPDTCFSCLDDVIRSTIVVRYLDDPERLAVLLVNMLKQFSVESEYKPRSLDSGYYAYHFYFKVEVSITDERWQSVSRMITAEIQITTQLQEIMKSLTHTFYRTTRIKPRSFDESWKWDHKSPRFLGSYLGHTLHLLEGMIVQLRETCMASASEESPTDIAEME